MYLCLYIHVESIRFILILCCLRGKLKVVKLNETIVEQEIALVTKKGV